MASGFSVGKCWYHHSESGYRAVLNGPDARSACEAWAGRLKAAATGISGIDYHINSMGGTRIHTRLTTVTRNDFFRERHYHALQMVAGGRR